MHSPGDSVVEPYQRPEDGSRNAFSLPPQLVRCLARRHVVSLVRLHSHEASWIAIEGPDLALGVARRIPRPSRLA